jgi:hypothetical protein
MIAGAPDPAGRTASSGRIGLNGAGFVVVVPSLLSIKGFRTCRSENQTTT